MLSKGIEQESSFVSRTFLQHPKIVTAICLYHSGRSIHHHFTDLDHGLSVGEIGDVTYNFQLAGQRLFGNCQLSRNRDG